MHREKMSEVRKRDDERVALFILKGGYQNAGRRQNRTDGIGTDDGTRRGILRRTWNARVRQSIGRIRTGNGQRQGPRDGSAMRRQGPEEHVLRDRTTRLGSLWSRAGYPSRFPAPDPESEKEMLAEKAEFLRSELEAVKKRMDEIESRAGKDEAP